jgi:hypothetical protein
LTGVYAKSAAYYAREIRDVGRRHSPDDEENPRCYPLPISSDPDPESDSDKEGGQPRILDTDKKRMGPRAASFTLFKRNRQQSTQSSSAIFAQSMNGLSSILHKTLSEKKTLAETNASNRSANMENPAGLVLLKSTYSSLSISEKVQALNLFVDPAKASLFYTADIIGVGLGWLLDHGIGYRVPETETLIDITTHQANQGNVGINTSQADQATENEHMVPGEEVWGAR